MQFKAIFENYRKLLYRLIVKGKIFVWIALGIALVVVAFELINQPLKYQEIKIKLSEKYLAWQGVATNGKYIYVATDRDKNFNLEDIISVYDMKGTLIKEKHNAYTMKDSNGKFMSFGGISIIKNEMFATVYNINGGGKPYISRVEEYSLPNLEIVKGAELGSGIAESIQRHGGFYWVSYYDKQVIGKFDLHFNHIKDYALSQPMGQYGGYQGMMWYKGDVYLNMHGPNKYGKTPEEALDRYSFDGKKFHYVETIKPATYGTTQDIQYFKHKFYWNDRPANEIVITTKLEKIDQTENR